MASRVKGEGEEEGKERERRRIRGRNLGSVEGRELIDQRLTGR